MSPKLSKPLSPGDVITEDIPIVHSIVDDFKDKYCDNCVQRSDQLKRCSKCLHMYYCSKECQKNDWKYHKNECSVYRKKWSTLESVNMRIRFWLRLYLSVQNIPTFATKKYRLFDGSDVSLNDIKDNAIDSNGDNDDIELFETICELFTELGVDYVCEELMQWSPLMNSYNLYYLQCGAAGSVATVALCLNLQTLTLSHSCRPNSCCISRFNGHTVELRAMRSIAPGEEITVSRVDLKMDPKEKQLALKSMSIDCQCVKCVDNTDRDVDYRRLQPDVDKSVLSGFKSSAQLETYLRSLLKDLDVVYGDYHPLKTMTLINYTLVYIHYLMSRRSAPDSLFKEIRDLTEKALKVTNWKDCPFKTRFYYNLNLFYTTL